MAPDEAEAVLLVAVFFYDSAATPNPALPGCLAAIPWGHAETASENPDWLRGRWLQFFVHGYCEHLLQAARWAASRLETLPAAGPPPDAHPKPNACDRAYAAFLKACQENNELDQDTPGKEHHDWLRDHGRDLLENKGDKNPETWARYARGGLRKYKGPAMSRVRGPTRSVLRVRDLDQGRDADS